MILRQWGTLGIFGASTWQGYLGYVVEVEGLVDLGNRDMSTPSDCADRVTLYQHTDNVLHVPLVDSVYGGVVPASSFSRAEYVVATASGRVQLRLSLGEGISVDEDDFRIFIDDKLIDDTFRGEMVHQLVLWNDVGDKIPPVFKDRINIRPVLL